MYIKYLKIISISGIIREIYFKNGMNLIVDDTPLDNQKLTGNNVGKTTVLKLIYFCLGGNENEIYTDEEMKQSVYIDLKNYLIDEEILIELALVDDIDKEKNQIVIERNFLKKGKAILKINGKNVLKKDFEKELTSLIYPNHKIEKPTFKQIISHNIRYKEESINKTIKTLNRFTTDVEYESLYLYLLGCTFEEGAQKQNIFAKINQEKLYKERLEKNQTKNYYEFTSSILKNEIDELNKKKNLLNLNKNFENDLLELNNIKYKINKSSSNMIELEIRRNIIIEAKNGMEKDITDIDLKELEILYKEVRDVVKNLQKSFEDLVIFHNKMLKEKMKFIIKELPDLNKEINREKILMNSLLLKEKELSLKISKSDSFEELEKFISEINEKYRLKGECDSKILQINEVENNLTLLEDELKKIDNFLYSESFENKLKSQINKFNKYFSEISNKLYGERYALKYKKEQNKKTNKYVYKFTTFNTLNMSSGKKQGEILCFDLAYIKFANEENIPCLKFLLNDKKELMHDNQLINVVDFVRDNKIQLIISVLKDKLPDELIEKSNISIELSQQEKLFKFK